MSLQELAAFLGWCTVINMVILAVAAFSLIGMRGTMAKLHSAMFGVSEPDLLRIYFKYIAYYKIAIFMFNLVPYIALRVML